MLNLTIKIRLHLQKSSHLVFSPKIAIFVLSCKEIRRRRRRNGQAGARPCKRTVGDAGIGTGKASQTADIHQAYKCAGATLSALFSLLLETFFVSESAQTREFKSVYQQLTIEFTIFRRSKAVPIKAHFACAKLCAEAFWPILGTRFRT